MRRLADAAGKKRRIETNNEQVYRFFSFSEKIILLRTTQREHSKTFLNDNILK